MFEGFPYTNFHDLNLDWIIEKLKECYSPDNPPDDVVLSVNGETGEVILYKNASIDLPAVEEDTWNIVRTVEGSMEGIQFQKNGAAERVNGTHRFVIYDAGNPPPYPVTSVNGRTGNVTITIPVSSVGGLTGDVAILNTEIVTDAGQQKLRIIFPVSTVDGQTGTVNTWGYTSNANIKPPIEADGDSWGIIRDIPSGTLGLSFEYDDTEGTYSAYLTFKEDGSSTTQRLKLLTPNEIPSSSGVVSINGATGVVILTAADIAMGSGDNTTVAAAITYLLNNIGDTWSSANSYLEGSYVIYNKELYKATDDNSAGTWESQSWTAVNVGDELSTLTSGLAAAEDDIDNIENALQTKADKTVISAAVETGTTASSNYNAGDYILINDILYKAITNISTSDTFSSTNVEAVTVGEELNALTRHFTSDESIVSLVLQSDATTTTTTVNTYSGRKFSDFQFIIAALFASANDRQRIRDCKIIPTFLWGTTRSFDLFAHHGATFENFSVIHFGYDSDTSFTVQAQAGGTLVGYQLWGFMKKSID